MQNIKLYIKFDTIILDRIYPPGTTIVVPIFFYLFHILFLLFLFPSNSYSQIDLSSTEIPSNIATQKNTSELGIHFGNFSISGDTPPQYSKNYGGGFHYRSALNNVISLRYDLLVAKTHGVGANPFGTIPSEINNIFEGYNEDNPYFFSYQSNVFSLGADLLFELTNLAPQIKFKSWNVHLGLGLGVYNSNTRLNLKDSAGLPYSDLKTKVSFDIENDYNTTDGRKAIKSAISEIYDNTYETPGPKKAGVFRLGNETNIFAYAKITLGVTRKISRRFSLGLEYSAMFSDNDLLDGNRWRTESDLSNHNDVMHYLNIRLNYNINKNSNPLYWVNPWDEQEEKLKREKELLDSLAHDTDLDGVADINDLEKNSLANCPVDRDGVVLDSDKDGKPDCLDSKPYLNDDLLEDKIKSVVDQLSQQNTLDGSFNPEDILSKEEYTAIMDSLINEASHRSLIKHLNSLIPEIYYNKNQHIIDEYGHKQIMSVVRVLEEYPNIKIQLTGHSSNEGDHEYNLELSKKRTSSIKSFLTNSCGINPNRIQTNGLGSSNARFMSDQNFWYLDRRVSFLFY